MGLIARKLLAEVGQAIIVAATAASSSTPSPLPHSDESELTSPFNRNPDLNPILAITAALLMSIFFIISFFSIYFQRCFIHVAGFDHDRIMMLYNGGSSPPSSTALLPPSGLDGSFLETLPKVIFSSSCSSLGIQKEKKKEVAAATECAICLEEFSEQETLRLLPHCGHSFHLECINMWLYSHNACPLCRHSLLHPGGGGNNDDTVAVAIAVNSQNNVATTAVNSVATEEALQVRAAGTPKNTRGEGEEEEGESSEDRPGVIAMDKLGNGDLPSSC